MSAAEPMPAPTPEHRAQEARLLDQCRAAEAVLYGRRIELCMHTGLRDQAHDWRRAMEKVIRDRHDAALQAFEEGGMDFFTASASAVAQTDREAHTHA